MSKPKSPTPSPAIERNEKGDFKHDHTPFDWEKFRWWEGTHIFEYFQDDKEYPTHRPYFDLHHFLDDRLEEARQHPDYFEKVLFETTAKHTEPEKWNASIVEHNWWLHLFFKYFKEVFDDKSAEHGTMPQFKYWRIILPKKLYAEIESVIEEYGLQKIHDLIFEIIAVAQHIFTDDVFRLEKYGYEKRINNIKKEAETVSEILYRMFDDTWKDGERVHHPNLDYINFVFQDGAKRIEDPWLMDDIMSQFKKHLETDMPYKNYQKEMKRYHVRYRDIKEKLQFKFELALSLYNILTKENFIPVTVEKPFPNKVVNCITKIMDFCLIQFASKPDPIFEEKTANVRNWLKRKTLDEKITFLPVVPDMDRLQKYFEPEFLNITNPVKGADAINIGFYICKRFDFPEEYIRDFVHIAHCLRHIQFLIGHQLIVEGSTAPSPFEEHNALKTLVKAMTGKKKIVSLKFQVEGGEKEYQFTERLPNYIFEQAIKTHYKEHEEDFQCDIIKGKVTQAQPNKYKFDKEKKFHLPAEQFAVRFVKSFYKYLLTELPPGAREHSPSHKYFSVIATMMQQTWFFNQLRDPEDFIYNKVEHWFSLSDRS